MWQLTTRNQALQTRYFTRNQGWQRHAGSIAPWLQPWKNGQKHLKLPWKNGFVILARMTDVIYDSRKIALIITLYVNNWGSVGCCANLLKQSWLLIFHRPRKSAIIKEKSSFWLNFYSNILTLTHLTLSSSLPWWRSRCRRRRHGLKVGVLERREK